MKILIELIELFVFNSKPNRYEPHYNQALLAEKMGHYDLSFNYVKKSLELYPDHYASQELLTKVKKLYETV